MDTSILEAIGLTKSETQVYLSLLELGSSTTGPLVDKSGAASSKIYEILDRLIQKGLASFVIKAGTKYFEAVDPQRLLDYLHEKEAQLKQKETELKKLLPELQLKQTLSKYKSEAQIYKGMKGLDTAFKDVFRVCKKGDEVCVFVVGELDERLNAFFIRQYTERAKRGIKTKTIFSEAGRKYYESRKNLPYFEGKVIGTTSSPATVQIYGNKVNLRIGGAENVVCMVIDNKQLAKSFKEQFDALWNQKVTVYEGEKNVTSFFTNILSDLHCGDEYFVINGNYGGISPVLRDFFYHYHPQRIARGIKANLLFNNNLRKEAKYLALPPVEVKFLPPDFKSPLQITFYKNKLYISLWEEKPLGFLIESERLVKAFKVYFDTLWKQDVRVVSGLDAVQDIFEEMLEAGHVDFIGARGYFMDARPAYRRGWAKRAQASNFTMRNIVEPDVRGHTITKLPFAQTKYTLPPNFSPLSVFWIYGNKVIISNWMQKEPLLFIIENEHLHYLYKQQFEALWKQK